MKRRMVTKMMCLLMSGILLVSGAGMPVHATEGEPPGQETGSGEAGIQETDLEENDDAESRASASEEETETAQPQTNGRTEDSLSEQETLSNEMSDEISNEMSDSELTDDVLTTVETTEQENTEETTAETIEETTEEETATANMQVENSGTGKIPEYAEYVVNPLYEDIADPGQTQAEWLEYDSDADIRSAAQTFSTVQDAAEYVRGQMTERSETIAFYTPDTLITSNETFSAFTKNVVDSAVAYTEDCTGQEGDALLCGYLSYQVRSSSGEGTVLITYTFTYHTTNEQERALTAAVDSALGELDLGAKTDYQKIKLIHDYICDHVDYDDTYQKYSAYEALCNGKSVCQGYAALFYRMCKDAGLSVRVITGTGNGGPHAWNIVKLGLKYYNVDCTWDGQDTETRHTYFLQNEEDFGSHVREEQYNTEAFNTQYPMADASYTDESEFAPHLDKDNLTASFTTLDEQKVTSAAEGKPKLLVFFRTTCPNSISTIRSIAGHDFSGIDILAVEIDNKEKSAVAEFKDTYGGGNITFCYDTSGSNNSCLWSYAGAAGIGGSVALPVICYIDVNNKLQHVTQGLSNAGTAEANIIHYCDASLAEEYTITYVLNGGTNNSGNPTSYRSTSDTIILKDPVRTGWTFAGWYLDAAFNRKVTQIDRGNTGNITLYAKWEGKQASDKLNLDNPDCELITIDGDYVYTTAKNKPKVLIFFSVNCGKSKQTIQGIARQKLTDVDIYAIDVIGSTKEAVTNFKNTYGSDDIVFCWDNLMGNINAQNKYLDVSKFDGFGPPLICYIDVNNKFQHITEGSSTADTIIANINAYCYPASETPDEPQSPETPSEPESPENPDEPESPTNPDEPETPDEPESPTTPDESESPENPDEPESPEDPGETEIGLRVQEIADVYYTGKPCKPAVIVYDGRTLLKAGRDYKVSYSANNKEVNQTKKKGDGSGDNFREDIPYAVITGMGNYTSDSLRVNFNILPAVIADDKGNQASTVKLRYTEQMAVNKSKTVNPLRSVACGRSMRSGVDYEASIKPVDAFDQSGVRISPDTESEDFKKAVIPAGYTGVFELRIKGIHNYSGIIIKKIYVAEKSNLIKNVKITLGKNIKNQAYTGKPVTLTPAYYDAKTKKYYLVENGEVTTQEADAADVFTVSAGNDGLVCQRDFEVSYDKNSGAGNALMIITGMGDYVGVKSAVFQIKGMKLTAGTVDVKPEDKAFTGKEVTQDNIRLTYKDAKGSRELKYNEDYTISYKNNIDKGTASMTFTAKEGSAYSGSFTKKFKITAADITQMKQADSMKNISAAYKKSGIDVSDQIKLTNAAGIELVNGKDYTIRYKNQNAPANKTDDRKPTIIIAGKGNYAGTCEPIYFTITQGTLDDAEIIKTVTPAAYNDKKASDYEYKPSVKIKDGKYALSPTADYQVVYEKNTQADYESYLKKLGDKTATKSDIPVAVITARENGKYTITNPEKEIRIPLPIYQNRMAGSNLHIVVNEAVYTGRQVKPDVSVYYSNDASAVKKAKGLQKESDILALGLVKLEKDKDYTLTYGANIAAGKNKGSVKISGISPDYGGEVTVKFTIQSKKMS